MPTVANPLIDDVGVIPFSSKKGSAVIMNAPHVGSTFCSDIIDGLHDLLLYCGWGLTGSTKAVAQISYPLGFPSFPVTEVGSGACGCGKTWVSVGNPLGGVTTYSGFVAGASPSGNCVFFEWGATASASLTNLALAISETSLFNAVVGAAEPTGFLLTLTAKTGGPWANFCSLGADGSFGIADSIFQGGGYTFSSIGESIYFVTITGRGGGFPSYDQLLQFDFSFGISESYGTCEYQLGTLARNSYTLVANPFSFAIFDASDRTPIADSLAVFAPCISSNEGFAAAYAVTVIGPGNFRANTFWDGYYGAVTVCLSATCWTSGNCTGVPRVLALRSPGTLPLATPDSAPVQQAAYLQMGQTPGGLPYIVGKLWDCAVVNDLVSGYLNVGGRNYVALGGQDGSAGGTRSTLLFCVGDLGQPTEGNGGSGGGTGTGGGSGGGGPATAPPLTGTCSGDVPSNTVGTACTVTQATGDAFSSAMIGQVMTVSSAVFAFSFTMTVTSVSGGSAGTADGTLIGGDGIGEGTSWASASFSCGT